MLMTEAWAVLENKARGGTCVYKDVILELGRSVGNGFMPGRGREAITFVVDNVEG